VYGRQPEGESADENAAFAPQTEYAKSKVEAEAALAKLASRDFSPIYLRQSTAYGWSDRLRLDLVLNNFVAWALATGEVRLLSRGDQWRPLAHVKDLSAAFIAALNAPRDAVHDTALNVGDDRANYRIRDLADAAAAAVGASVRADPGAEADTRSYRVSFGKIHERLPAWRPQWDAAKGAAELKQQMTRHGFRASDLEDERFIRLRRIQRLRSEGRVDPHLRPLSGLVA
jgi:nucleoside-diphosphate-sugar epimerase